MARKPSLQEIEIYLLVNPPLKTMSKVGNSAETKPQYLPLWKYEVTLLRTLFIDEMKRLESEWVEGFNKSQIQRDIDLAVFSHCEIVEWIKEFVHCRNKQSLELVWDRMYPEYD